MMMRKILLFLLLLPVLGSAKDYRVKLYVESFPSENNPLLLRIFNGNTYIVDSVPVINGKEIIFNVPEYVPSGMLQVILGASEYDRFMGRENRSVLFLFDKEDVELSMNFADPGATLKVVNSEVNKAYFDFLMRDGYFYRKLGTLEQVIINYPDRDAFYNTALDFYTLTQVQRENLIDSIYNANPTSLASRVILRQKMPFWEADISIEERDNIFRDSFFEKIDFSDSVLLYTNVYTDKLFQYIQTFFSNAVGPRENEENVIEALDRLFPYINQDDFVRDNLVQFLITSFESMKMEEVLAHIAANYTPQCGASVDLLAQRLDRYQKMAIGSNVPDFEVHDLKNKPVSLYGLKGEYKLVVFWHSGCSHCIEFTRGMVDLNKKGFFKAHGVDVISVSLDEEKEGWVAYSKENSFPWLNTYAEEAFESQVAIDFNIFATPSVFLLDKENKIIAKPLTIEELKAGVEKL